MDPTDLNNVAFSGYDLSPDSGTTFHHRSSHPNLHEAPNTTGYPPHYTNCGFDHDSSSYPSHPSRDTTNTTPNNTTAAMAPPPFEVPKLWREAMQCVSINANLYPQQILHKYYDLFATQSALHPGHIELDVWRSKRATERGVRMVQVRYLDNDPGRIYLMVIFLDAPVDPNTQKPVIRLVTNTSIHHVLEEPCANCPLWLKVVQNTDAAKHQAADSPYQIVPCCDEWVGCVDFDGPISNEEKQVPAVVARLIDEVKKRNMLLHAKEREIEAKEKEIEAKEQEIELQDARIRRLIGTDGQDPPEIDVVVEPTMRRRHSIELPSINMEVLEQYWWVVAIVAIYLMVWVLK